MVSCGLHVDVGIEPVVFLRWAVFIRRHGSGGCPADLVEGGGLRSVGRGGLLVKLHDTGSGKEGGGGRGKGVSESDGGGRGWEKQGRKMDCGVMSLSDGNGGNHWNQSPVSILLKYTYMSSVLSQPPN